jgi:hypothetical protein
MKRPEAKQAEPRAADKPADSNESAASANWERFLILITCRDEREQVELLRVFQEEGLTCRALLS